MNNIVSVIAIFIVTFFAALGYLTIPSAEQEAATDTDMVSTDRLPAGL